jgi:hypothetical protein
MESAIPNVSALLQAMADGAGEHALASPAWVHAAGEALRAAVDRHAGGNAAAPGRFTLCKVAHNAPAHLHAGPTLAWHARIDGTRVEVASGELPAAECDFKVHGDHSLLSNLARIQYRGRDPRVVALAQARLRRVGRFDVHGALPAHPATVAVLRSLHDAMAAQTLPRFVFMTPEWVSSARHILTARATSAALAPGLRDVTYTFSEEFTQTPRYAFPDGAHGGFWVRAAQGHVTVGAGPLPAELGPADTLTKGAYTPVVAVGRTVNAAMTEAETAERAAYAKRAFEADAVTGARPVERSSPSGRGPMPPELGRVFATLHDELSKRTSGEHPVDHDASIRPEWAPPAFDRLPDYDRSWLRYDSFDIYGQPLAGA